jgi:hypothetical protein
MKNLFQIGSIKLSPFFVVLIIVTFSIFAFAMINLTRLPSPEEKRLESIRQMEEAIIAEQAQAMGGTVEEVKLMNQDNARKNKLIQNLIKAINQQDDVAVSSLIHQLKDENKRLPHVFTYAVNANNEHAFRTLLETGISCDYPSLLGTQAFMVAISSESPAYLNMLLEKKCSYSAHSDSDSLGKRIVQSRYPEKIFQLPENLVENKYRDEGFLKAINKKMSQQVMTMLDLSANPNATNHRHMSALYLSLRNNMPQVALRLIQKGAQIEAEHLVGRYEVLSWAIMKGYLDIADEIIKRNPDYIQQKNLSKSIMKSAFSLKNIEKRTKALKLLQQSIAQTEFDEIFMNDIIRYRKSNIALTMLDLGINPNAFSKSANASALYLSLQNNMPDVAMRLIQLDAKIGAEHVTNGQYDVVSTAIKKGYLEVVHEMLKRDPNYFRRNDLDRTALSAALYVLKDKKLRQEALTLLLQNGVEPQKLQNGGIRWLIKAVELQDPILVKQLLDAGIDPNIRSKMRIALGVAKSIDNSKSFGVDKPDVNIDKDKIIAVLKQYGATNNFLAIVRDEKGLNLNLNCSLGRVVNIETKTVAEKYAQRTQNNPATKLMNNNELVMCRIATANCTNQGFGADSCMRSVQVCDTSDSNQAPICCTSPLKKRYFEARCSGLDVSEATHWMALGHQSKP